MGTRGLTCVVKDGKFKVAQYGQWDHYPKGQGLTILNFLHSADLVKFAEKVDSCWFATDEQVEAAYRGFIDEQGWMTVEQSKAFKQSEFGYLDRDTGGKILEVIMKAEKPLMLQDQSDFAADGLFCEWAYVVDLDKKTFEVYSGFHESKAPEGERFASMNDKAFQDHKKKFGPVHLAKSYSLDSLPDEQTFLSDLEENE